MSTETVIGYRSVWHDKWTPPALIPEERWAHDESAWVWKKTQIGDIALELFAAVIAGRVARAAAEITPFADAIQSFREI